MTSSPLTKHRRHGFIGKRVQFFSVRIQRWIERNTITGRFLNVKANSKPFKGVRKLKP